MNLRMLLFVINQPIKVIHSFTYLSGINFETDLTNCNSIKVGSGIKQTLQAKVTKELLWIDR